jgi:hypothetical protein
MFLLPFQASRGPSAAASCSFKGSPDQVLSAQYLSKDVCKTLVLFNVVRWQE